MNSQNRSRQQPGAYLIAALLVSVCALLQPLSAQAQARSGHRGHGAARLKAADTNHDGQLSRDEAQAAFPKQGARFSAADSDGDGELSRDELKAYRARLKEQKAADVPAN